MFLSRIHLDRYNRNTLKALNSLSIFHGAIESSFLGERKRNLWRIDKLGGQLYILLLSETKPELSSFCSQFAKNKFSFETKSYDKLLARVRKGNKYKFRLTANPTKSLPRENGERGKVFSHTTIEFQKEWLVKISEKNGFSVNNSFDVVQSRKFVFYKERRKLSFISVTYEGILEVIDADLFRNALINGIGREKAYGMGLLTIIKV
ncbi:MAG: type I-E CRISPR-associated protein Cas6/Cse3/CasE [Ruminococcus sp.]|nr:type I-E CRISPR-associated protein Cas6/Cse3/CasE [Ruminococcus sp.]